MANRMADACIASTSTPRRLANSSSFPTERSKLPKPRASPARNVSSVSARYGLSQVKNVNWVYFLILGKNEHKLWFVPSEKCKLVFLFILNEK